MNKQTFEDKEDDEIKEGLNIFLSDKELKKHTWEKFSCPRCKTENWINWDIDFMAEVCICFVCHHEFWIDYNAKDVCENDMSISNKIKGKITFDETHQKT